MGRLSDKLFGKRKQLDLDMINKYMAPTQQLINEQLGYGRDMMDPESAMNMQYRNFLQSQNQTAGQNIGSQVQKIGAMGGASSAQTMMQARMGMSNAMGSGQNTMMNFLQGQQQQGLGLLGGMTGMQQGLNENQANAYVQRINAHNAARSSRMNMLTGLAGAAIGGWGASQSGDTINVS